MGDCKPKSTESEKTLSEQKSWTLRHWKPVQDAIRGVTPKPDYDIPHSEAPAHL